MNTSLATTPEMEQYALIYESKLPFMFELIGSQSRTPPGEHGMTPLQAEFWRVVWQVKDRINSDVKHIHTPTVVRQFYLEAEVWGTFWNEKSFPSKYPIPTQSQAIATDQTVSTYEVQPAVLPPSGPEASVIRTPTPQSSNSQSSIAQAPAGFSNALPQPNPSYSVPKPFVQNMVPQNTIPRSPTHPDPLTQELQPNFAAHPPVPKPALTPYLLNEARKIIFTKKGYNYVPKHGWDKETGLPMYSILCFARNGFHAFCGEHQRYFSVVRETFSSFCVMFQKIQRGFMAFFLSEYLDTEVSRSSNTDLEIFQVIWLEARSAGQTVALGIDPELWKKFKECWVFLKSWASQPGDTVNVVTYMENYAGDPEAEAQVDHLLPPPHPAWL